MEHPQRSRRALSHERVDLWWISLVPPARELDALASTLSVDEHQRAAAFRFDEHRTRFIAARGILRSILAGYLSIAPKEVDFTYGPNGKHAVKVAGEPLSFNLSHSGDWAVCAVSSDRAIGVDVERVRPLNDADRIAKRICSAREQSALEACPEDARHAMLFAYWTCKEAFAKARGEGLGRSFSSIEIELDASDGARLLSVDGSQTEAARWQLEMLFPVPGYVSSIAVEGRGWTLDAIRHQLPPVD